MRSESCAGTWCGVYHHFTPGVFMVFLRPLFHLTSHDVVVERARNNNLDSLAHTHSLVDPNMMPTMRVDKGAISFVMNGANIMCQGFTSKGGRIETPLEAGAPVVSRSPRKLV